MDHDSLGFSDRLWKALRMLDIFISGSLGRPVCTAETRNTETEHGYSSTIDMTAIIGTVLKEVYGTSAVSEEFIANMTQGHRLWAKRMVRGLEADGIDAAYILEKYDDEPNSIKCFPYERIWKQQTSYCRSLNCMSTLLGITAKSWSSFNIEQRNSRIVKQKCHWVTDLFGYLNEETPSPSTTFGKKNAMLTGDIDELVFQSPVGSSNNTPLSNNLSMETEADNSGVSSTDISLDFLPGSQMTGLSDFGDILNTETFNLSSFGWL